MNYTAKKEVIKDYAYNGYYISETNKGFMVQSPKLGRATVHVGKTFVGAKLFIDSIDDKQQKEQKQDFMAVFMANIDKAIENTK